MKKRKLNFINKTTSSKNHLSKQASPSSKKTEKNQRLTLLGWIDRARRKPSLLVEPFLKEFPRTIFISNEEVKHHQLQMYEIVRVALRQLKSGDFEASVIEGPLDINSPDLEIEIAQQEHQFSIPFSVKAIADAERDYEELDERRVDLRKLPFVTIDGETARDFDDAIYVTTAGKNKYRAYIAIADVSFYVREGTPLYEEAYDRATSIYFPDRAIPMLPERLSTDQCSLVPHEDRRTLTCEVEMSSSGEILRSAIYPSLINSKARLTYTRVQKFIDGDTKAVPSEVCESLENAVTLARIIRAERTSRGSLDLDLPELKMQVDEKGDVTGVEPESRLEAHKLIEDLMILANEVVSTSIEKRGYASIYRIHEDPDPVKIEALNEILKRWGFKLKENAPVEEALQKFLDQVRGHASEKALVTSLLRSLKQAKYATNNAGHFGLGSTSYTHFTSPIRRFPDLLVHRILRESHFLRDKYSPLTVEKLSAAAEHCSARERRAFLAERDILDMKKCRFMSQFVGKKFEGVVSSVKNFGIFVEIRAFGIEGLIPLRMLPDDYWITDQHELELKGRRSKLSFRLGDAVRVHLEEVHRLKRQITFRYIAHLNERPQHKKRSHKDD